MRTCKHTRCTDSEVRRGNGRRTVWVWMGCTLRAGRMRDRDDLLAEERAARADTADLLVRECTEEDRSHGTAHAVDAPYVEGVVPLESVLDLAAAEAEDRRDDLCNTDTWCCWDQQCT